MGLKKQRESDNKKQLAAFPKRISDVEMKTSMGDFTVDVIKKEIKNYKNQTKDILTVDHEEFPAEKNMIRIYLPIMGAYGFIPTEDQVRALFKGETIHPKLISKNDKEYQPNISFSPLAEHEYNGKVTYYGDIKMTFDNE